MKAQDLLPKRVTNYIREMGVRALDHLASHIEPPAPAVAPEGEAAPTESANATQTLVDQWKGMSTIDKEQFVERVSASVIEVIVASATLPLGLKVDKKTVKKAKKVIRKRVKRVRKAVARSAARPEKESSGGAKPKKNAGPKPKKKRKS